MSGRAAKIGPSKLLSSELVKAGAEPSLSQKPVPEEMLRSAAALVVERMTVKTGRLVCDVIVAPHAPRMTNPELAARIREAFPDIERHACVNDEGDTFGVVLDHTSLPHVLEHLVIDLQAHAQEEHHGETHASSAVTPAQHSTRARDVFVGTTTWTDRRTGKAHIEVSFTDDLVALRAFRDATHFLNSIMVI